MQRKKVSMYYVTHKAQNLQHNIQWMRDWVRYVLGQMKVLNIPHENVSNFDWMNLNFSIEMASTH
jgi:hypothetical protein